ncbi:hypothetical protein [Streptomyces sp. NPDC056061]|uniref:hypothetical protein n=1 Tax=Streptomyces sp. NPDC056061 TaxID=3345700 RepID=UPI0035D795ED
MHAPEHPPTPPRRVPGRAWIVSMRVLFTVLSVGSLGLLLWSPLLRLAIVRRRALDWWLAGAGFAFVCVLLPILGRDGDDEPTTLDGVLITLLLFTMAGSLAYYFVGDVRHHGRLAPPHLVVGHPSWHAGHGYATTLPMPAPTFGPAPMPQPPPYGPVRTGGGPAVRPPAVPPSGQEPRPEQWPQPRAQSPSQPPQSQRPSPPQRIEQVRAELDELSVYLRKEEGR